jgi:hypothetical protein
VSYTAYGTSTNNTHIYRNCQCPHFQGLVGSTVGGSSAGDALYLHNSTGTTSNQFNLIEVTGCNFANNTVSAAPAVLNLLITNSTYGGGVFTSPYKTVTQCHIIGGLPANADHTEIMTVNNCLIEYTNRVDATYPGPRQTAGTNLWTGNTIIATPPGGDDFKGGIFHETDRVNFQFTNNVVVMQGQAAFAIFEDFSTNDVLALGDNLYVLTNNIARDYTNATGVADLPFATWQTNGFDYGSLNVPGALQSPLALVCVGNSWVVGIGTDPVTNEVDDIQETDTNLPFAESYENSNGRSIFWFNLPPPAPGALAETFALDWDDYSTNLAAILEPEFSAQPTNCSQVAGGMATFGAEAMHASGYQWQRNGTNLVEDGHFVGVTNAVLTITPVQQADAGTYSVAAINAPYSLNSQPALLTVFSEVTLGLSEIDTNEFQLTVSNADGTPIPPGRVDKMEIYSTTNLLADFVEWNLSTNAPLLTNGILKVDYPDEMNGGRYWRVVEVP